MNLTSTDITSRRSRDVKLSDINFGPRLPLEQHPRYQGFRRLMGLRDFAAYREVFERGWAETSILCGEVVRLDEMPISEEVTDNSLLAKLMGVNEHSPKRARLAKEFFAQYERLGRSQFLQKHAALTDYVQDIFITVSRRMEGLYGLRRLLANYRLKREIRERVIRFTNLYENMKSAGTLVGRGCSATPRRSELRPEDLPWAIDYHGYVKLRDGAHRRAVAYVLGWETISTLVFEFGRVTPSNLKDAHPYIRDNFEWFIAIIRKVACLQAHAQSRY